MDFEGEGLFFSELSKYSAVDFNNKKMGHVGDVILDKDTLATRGLIVYGSILEEKLEDFGLKENIDPIIPIDQVDYTRFTEKVVAVHKGRHQLPTTSNEYSPPEGTILLSTLKKFQIVDGNNESMGHLTDVCFHSDGDKTLVVNPGKHVHIGNEHRYIQSREIMIPMKYLDSIHNSQIKLKLTKLESEEYKAVGLDKFINKDIRALEKGFDLVGSRYHYVTYSAKLAKIKKHLKSRESKINNSLKSLKIKEYIVDDPKMTNDFVQIFNEVALTAIDPYEELTSETAKKYFSKGSLLVYMGPKIIGYCVMSWKEVEGEKIASIAGIGVHHRHRGKGFSTAIIFKAIEYLESKDNFATVEADILEGNDASIGLFSSLGFKVKTDFFLC